MFIFLKHDCVNGADSSSIQSEEYFNGFAFCVVNERKSFLNNRSENWAPSITRIQQIVSDKMSMKSEQLQQVSMIYFVH